MYVSKITEVDLTSELIDKLLFHDLADTGENADCIIVLGSNKAVKYRVPAAIDAYKAGRANRIMLCGGTLLDSAPEKRTEAELMRKALTESGIPEERIILENSSRNTVENIRFGLVELQRAFGLNRVHKVLLVTTAYHMRRSLAIARYLFPAHITVIPCPADDTNTRRDNWMNTPAGVDRAKGEAMNIIRYVANGVIPDFEI